MVRSLFGFLFVLFFFGAVTPEAGAQGPTGVVGYVGNSDGPNGENMIEIDLVCDPIGFYEEFEIRIYFECGEDQPTPANPGTGVGGTMVHWPLPGWYAGTFWATFNDYWPPFAECEYGWFSVCYIIDGYAYWYFYEYIYSP